MQKEGQSKLHTIIKNYIPSNVFVKKNQVKSWKYGYDEKYDMIVISKDGTIGEVYNINGINIALPSVPKIVYKRDEKKENQYWEAAQYPKELSNIKTIFTWHSMSKEFKSNLKIKSL